MWTLDIYFYISYLILLLDTSISGTKFRGQWEICVKALKNIILRLFRRIARCHVYKYLLDGMTIIVGQNNFAR